MIINKNRGPKPSVSDFPTLNTKTIPPSISIVDLDTMIFNQGVRINLYKAAWCPRRKSRDGAEHEMDCPLCNGTEFIDTNCKETKAFIQGQTREALVSPENIGAMKEEQVVLCTFTSGLDITYYDKIELIDYSEPYKQLVTRYKSGNAISTLTPTSYNATTRTITTADIVKLNLVKSNFIFLDKFNKRFVIEGSIVNTTGIKSFKLFEGQGIPDISGPCKIIIPDIDRLQFKAVNVEFLMDYDGVQYCEGGDFIIDRNGDIEWSHCGNKPSDGKLYTIIYQTLVSYRATRAIHADRFLSSSAKNDHIEAISAPQQWLLKKLYLFKKTDSESGVKLEANTLFPKGE